MRLWRKIRKELRAKVEEKNIREKKRVKGKRKS
jgi:hypothetical protein